MSTLATDNKDCALLAPSSNREESQPSFNGKTEYGNRTHLTSWPTASNRTAEEVWPPGREFAANWPLLKEKFLVYTLGIDMPSRTL
jgi:hypothetical protein